MTDFYDAYSSDKNKEYFIGTTVVFDNHGQKELIDGQQRTTTLFLILCAFHQLYMEIGLPTEAIDKKIKDYRVDKNGLPIQQPRLVLQYSDCENVIEKIINHGEIKEVKSLSAERLIEAYSTIYEFLRVNSADNPSELGKLFVYFFRKLKFIQILAPDINDALKIFETINDRGIGLNPMDLLKNLIFQQVERSKFEGLKSKWKSLIDTLEKANERPLRFLRYYIVSNHPSPDNSSNPLNKGENMVREDEIYKWFTRESNACLYSPDPNPFVDDLIDNARCYVNFAMGKDKDGNANYYLENINKLGGKAFRQHLILLLTARSFTAEMFNYLCKSIETYLFYCLLTKEQAKIYEKLFGKWNLSLCKVHTIEELRIWVSENIKPEISKKESDFKVHFLNFKQDDLQLYRVRYILAKIAQYVDEARKGVPSPSSIQHYLLSGVEIEHILPWTPLPGMEETIVNYHEWKIMLGNLTLLEKSMNSVIGNKSFEEKVQEYAKCPYYITSSLAKLDVVGENSAINRLNLKLRSFLSWNETSIQERQEMLYNLALEIWSID